MDNNQAMVGCALGSWVVAALAGALAAVLLLLVGGWGFLQAGFIGAVVFAAAGVLVSVIMCRPLPPLSSISNEAVSASETVPSAGAAPAPAVADSPQIKPSAPLAGQAELAERKGEWTYQAEAATSKVAKKPSAKPSTGPASTASDGPGTKPTMLTAARGDTPDNLKQIKGVGPKLEAVLHDMGFYHFDQIAAWDADEVSWVDQNLQGFKGRVSRDGWVEQAKILAEGGTTEFSSKVKKGGVY